MPEEHDTRGGRQERDTGEASAPALAQQLGEVARALQSEEDTDAMLDELVASAVRLIPGADEASISVVTGWASVTSEHPTGDLPALVDAIQTETGQGPCLDAASRQRTVRVPDVRRDERWPRFAERAADAGAGSMLSFQLWVEGDDLGALNLYSREANAFDDESEQVGLLFASHAAVAFADARKVDQLQHAIGSRDVIGQAKGILMERYGIDDVQAFRVLARVSQGSHRKLHDVAAELVRTRSLPDLPS